MTFDIFNILVGPSIPDVNNYIGMCSQGNLNYPIIPKEMEIGNFAGIPSGTATINLTDKWRPLVVIGSITETISIGVRFTLIDFDYKLVVNVNQQSGTNVSSSVDVDVIDELIDLNIDNTNGLINVNIDIGTDEDGNPLSFTAQWVIDEIENQLSGSDADAIEMTDVSTNDITLDSDTEFTFTLSTCTYQVSSTDIFNGGDKYILNNEFRRFVGINSLLFGNQSYPPYKYIQDLFLPNPFNQIFVGVGCSSTFSDIPILFEMFNCSKLDEHQTQLTTAEEILNGNYYHYSNPEYQKLIYWFRQFGPYDMSDILQSIIDLIVDCLPWKLTLSQCPTSGLSPAVAASIKRLVNLVIEYNVLVPWIISICKSEEGNIADIMNTAFADSGLSYDVYDRYNIFAKMLIRGVSQSCKLPTKRNRRRCY